MIEANHVKLRYSVIAIASNVVLEFLVKAGDIARYGAIVSKLILRGKGNQLREDAQESSYLSMYQPIWPRI